MRAWEGLIQLFCRLLDESLGKEAAYSSTTRVPGVLNDVAPEAVGQLRAPGLHPEVVGLRVQVLLGILQVAARVQVQSGLGQRPDPGQDLGKWRLLHVYTYPQVRDWIRNGTWGRGYYMYIHTPKSETRSGMGHR